MRLRHLSLDARAARWPAALSLCSGRFFRFNAIASPDRRGDGPPGRQSAVTPFEPMDNRNPGNLSQNINGVQPGRLFLVPTHHSFDLRQPQTNVA